MSSENPTYTVLVAPSSYAGLVTARTSDGGNFRSRQPLLDGARYWVRRSANPAATIITAWSSGNGEWVLRATSSAMPLSLPCGITAAEHRPFRNTNLGLKAGPIG